MAIDSQSSHRLVIPNQLSALREMSAWLDASIRLIGAPEELIFNIDLCANEAVTNIISYGYPDNGEHEITLLLTKEPHAVQLTIEDDGTLYNPLDRPEHVQPTGIDDAEIGGLGVDLIRSFMTECHYARERGRNILTMISRIPDES